MRFAAASAASRSTIGYSQGRAASQKLRKPATAIFRDDSQDSRSISESSIPSQKSSSSDDFQTKARDIIEQLRLQDLNDDEDDGILGPTEFVDDDEYADFQLMVPTAD
jgi:hypothetical protein